VPETAADAVIVRARGLLQEIVSAGTLKVPMSYGTPVEPECKTYSLTISADALARALRELDMGRDQDA